MSDISPGTGLSSAQLSSFEENGFLAIEQLLGEDDLLPLETEYAALLDRFAHKLYREGKIPELFEAMDFGDRFAAILGHFPELHTYFNISLPLINGEINPATYHMHSGPAVFGDAPAGMPDLSS